MRQFNVSVNREGEFFCFTLRCMPQIRNDFHTKIAHKCHVQSSLLLQRQRQRVCPRHTSTRMPQFRCSTVSGCSYAISMLFIDGPGRKLVSPESLNHSAFQMYDFQMNHFKNLHRFAQIMHFHLIFLTKFFTFHSFTLTYLSAFNKQFANG